MKITTRSGHHARRRRGSHIKAGFADIDRRLSRSPGRISPACIAPAYTPVVKGARSASAAKGEAATLAKFNASIARMRPTAASAAILKVGPLIDAAVAAEPTPGVTADRARRVAQVVGRPPVAVFTATRIGAQFFQDAVEFTPITQRGAWATILVTLGSLVLDPARPDLGPDADFRQPLGSIIAIVFINFIRGVPIIVQLFYIYFVMPDFGRCR